MSRDSDARFSPRATHRMAAALSALAAVPFTALFADVVASYWSFLGVDTPGAGCALIGVYIPAGFIVFLAVALAVFFCSRQRLIGPWQSLGLSVFGAAATLAIGVAVEAHRMSDYPRGAPATTGGFFRFYVQRLIGTATERPNQAMQLTASKPAVYPSRVCRRERMLRGMHRGLAAADLVSR